MTGALIGDENSNFVVDEASSTTKIDFVIRKTWLISTFLLVNAFPKRRKLTINFLPRKKDSKVVRN